MAAATTTSHEQVPGLRRRFEISLPVSHLTLCPARLRTTFPKLNRVHIKTYGCQMNERDSEAVAAMLRAGGYRIVADENECDILLLNTCSVRDAAEQKAIGKAGYLQHRQKARKSVGWGNTL